MMLLIIIISNVGAIGRAITPHVMVGLSQLTKDNTAVLRLTSGSIDGDQNPSIDQNCQNKPTHSHSCISRHTFVLSEVWKTNFQNMISLRNVDKTKPWTDNNSVSWIVSFSGLYQMANGKARWRTQTICKVMVVGQATNQSFKSWKKTEKSSTGTRIVSGKYVGSGQVNEDHKNEGAW